MPVILDPRSRYVVMSRAGGASPYGIVSITNSGGKCLFTVAANYGSLITGGESLTVTGTSVAGYNTTHTNAQPVSGTTFTTDNAYTSSATGGTWALA